MNDKNNNLFQDSLNLPQTAFSLRAQAAEKEPALLAFWQKNDISQTVVNHHAGAKTFILHDGPPYANGPIHMGHALNKILKDIVAKSKRQAGFHVPFVLGWDCHGLPIELKVASQENPSNEPLKKRCRSYAQGWIERQREEFAALGLLFDQKSHYTTMTPGYEAAIVRALASFVGQGYIERKGKAVPWCASCKTVLAIAEIEYKDRKDPSCYVRFRLADHDARMVFPLLFEDQQLSLDSISLLAWTTTSWSLPLNRAIALNPTAEYVVAISEKEKTDTGAYRAVILAATLMPVVSAQTGIELKELCRLDARALMNKELIHPLDPAYRVPVLLDESVTVSDGTAVLSVAPGCGPEDYQLALKHKLEIFSPLSADGCYTQGIQPAELVGMKVADGQWWVLKTLAEQGLLFHKGSLMHSYPHCWRCRQGLIFRATEQWFCDLQKNNLTEKAVEGLAQVEFIPSWGRARLTSFVSNRYEWCISRQRVWGAPIPALLCTRCPGFFISEAFVLAIAEGIEREGIEYWDRVTIAELQAQKIISENFSCSGCQADSSLFVKEKDILDVWFDSGTSHYAVLTQSYGLSWPADLYLEGSDQHRGWFQSSLLCAMVLQGKPPYKQLLTHGFILDEQKRKMSKSLGNGIEPHEIVAKYSRDILRLWVATVDYENDVVLSHKLLENVAEVYRKIRNTTRFLLSNLYDFTVDQAVHLTDLSFIDQQALVRLYEIQELVKHQYAQYNFSGALSAINNYCVKELSALYLDCVKDRLYCDKKDSRSRRSVQTVLFSQLDVITRLIAPVLSFMAEELFQEYRLKMLPTGSSEQVPVSVHLLSFAPDVDVKSLLYAEQDLLIGGVTIQAASYAVAIELLWQKLGLLRDYVLKALEEQRVQGLIKHSLEAAVHLWLCEEDESIVLLRALEKSGALGLSALDNGQPMTLQEFLANYFIVSQVSFESYDEVAVKNHLDWCAVRITHASGVKCPRCWQWSSGNYYEGASDSEISSEEKAALCHRCAFVLGS